MFPVFDDEHSWSEGVRCVLYLAGLLYFFLGVSIIADLFMEAIEVITSKTRVVKMGRHNVEVKVWNATIANLTLMALGSSAPEVRVSPHARCSAPPPNPLPVHNHHGDDTSLRPPPNSLPLLCRNAPLLLCML